MKKQFLLSIIMIFFSVPTILFGDGPADPNQGTADNPYQISLPSQLIEIGSDPALQSKHFILTNDIDLAGEFFPYAVIPEFAGQFDGNGKRISNLRIEAVGVGYVGLFGQLLDGARVNNLQLINCQVVGDGGFVGGLCGWNESGTIFQCSTSGIVVGGRRLSPYVGGLCGFNDGLIERCTNGASVLGDHYVGGLCGFNGLGQVSNSQNDGSINGLFCSGGICGLNESIVNGCVNEGLLSGGDYSDTLGGLCGHNAGLIRDCYNTQNATGRSIAGGLCGMNTGSIVGCFNTGTPAASRGNGALCGFGVHGDAVTSLWDSDVVTIANSGTGQGVPGLNLTDETFLLATGWDMVNETANGKMDAWYLNGSPLPKLYWMTADGDLDYDEAVSLVDMTILANRWLLTDVDMETNPQGVQIERLLGDMNDDGSVSLSDFAILSNAYMTGLSQ